MPTNSFILVDSSTYLVAWMTLGLCAAVCNVTFTPGTACRSVTLGGILPPGARMLLQINIIKNLHSIISRIKSLTDKVKQVVQSCQRKASCDLLYRSLYFHFHVIYNFYLASSLLLIIHNETEAVLFSRCPSLPPSHRQTVIASKPHFSSSLSDKSTSRKESAS